MFAPYRLAVRVGWSPCRPCGFVIWLRRQVYRVMYSMSLTISFSCQPLPRRYWIRRYNSLPVNSCILPLPALIKFPSQNRKRFARSPCKPYIACLTFGGACKLEIKNFVVSYCIKERKFLYYLARISTQMWI